MPFIIDAALDAAITVILETNRLDICSQEPTTYTEATSTYTVGNETTFGWGVIGDRVAAGGGRKVTFTAITSGTVTSDGATATHWALSDTATTALLATGALASSQVVYTANGFTLAAFDIGVPDAV